MHFNCYAKLTIGSLNSAIKTAEAAKKKGEATIEHVTTGKNTKSIPKLSNGFVIKTSQDGLSVVILK